MPGVVILFLVSVWYRYYDIIISEILCYYYKIQIFFSNIELCRKGQEIDLEGYK